MARKRKVQQALPAINEEAEAGSSKPLDQKVEDFDIPDSKESTAAQVEAIVKECKEQVELKAEALVEAARQRVQSVRADFDAAINKLTKQVRQTTAADFFALTPAEVQLSILYHVLPRLQALQQGNGDPKAVEAAGLVASSLAAVAAAAAPQQVQAAASAGPSASIQGEKQQEAGPLRSEHQQPAGDRQPTAQEQQTEQQQPLKQPCGKASAQAPACSPSKLTLASALMPPPPPRLPLAAANPPARQPLATEMLLYSANGSPVHLGQLIAPATTAKGTVPSLTDATPAAGTSYAGAPATMGFTGRTFRRAAPTRGRVKKAMRAITVTTEDGKQFTVDDLIGLAGVPQAYREEIRKLVEADHQDLSAIVQSLATQEQNDAPSVPAVSTSRPARRR